MKKYREEVKNRISSLEVKFVQIPREENKCADCLAKVASAEFMSASKQVLSFCPNLLAYWWQSTNAGSKFRRELDHAINSISEVRNFARRKRRRKKAKSPSLTICADQGCLVQERFLSTVPKVLEPWRSRLRNERSSRGYLWKSLRGTVVSTQVDLSWVLLAHYAEGCPSLRQDLRQVLEIQ